MSLNLAHRDIQAHPELFGLLGLHALLEGLPIALTAVHADGPAGALQDQARAILQVGRILSAQMNIYISLLELEDRG